MNEYYFPGSKQKLPPLLLDKERNRKLLEQDKTIKSLVNSGLLLEKDTNSLLKEVQNNSDQINSILEYDRAFLFDFIRKNRTYFGGKKALPLLANVLGIKLPTNDEKINKEDMSLFGKRLVQPLSELSNQNRELVANFEKTYKSELEILEDTTVYLCNDCNLILNLNKFKPMTCKCNKDIRNMSDCHILSIAKFSKHMSRFFLKNVWLENGLDNLFKKKGKDSLCGQIVLGHSGIEHEVDNLVYDRENNQIILGECKTGELTKNFIFIFSGKMTDIGCSKGFMATTTEVKDKKIFQLARSKNITLIDMILEKKDEQINIKIFFNIDIEE